MRPFLRGIKPEPELESQLKAKLSQLYGTDQNQERLSILGECGQLATRLNKLRESKLYLEEALELAKEIDDKPKVVANLIRLGTTLQYLDYHADGQNLLDEALSKANTPETTQYKDFALQHLGKLLAEKGLYDEAQECFLKALILRQKKGDQTLIDSTQNALDFIEELI